MSMTSQQQKSSSQQRSDLSVFTISPNEITSILLADGWHEVDTVEFTQFAVSPSASPPQPNKLYSAIYYSDRRDNKQVVTPLKQVLGFETNKGQNK